MERTKVQKLAQVLRVLVIVVFVCNIVALVFVPGAVALFQDGGYETISKSSWVRWICLDTKE